MKTNIPNNIITQRTKNKQGDDLYLLQLIKLLLRTTKVTFLTKLTFHKEKKKTSI